MRSRMTPLRSIRKVQGSVSQVEGFQLRPDPLRDFVVVVDLHVDEVGLALVLVRHLLGDVDHRPADPALAERRRREDEHDRFLAEDVGEVDLVHLVVGDAGVDLRQVAADVGGGRRVDQRRLFADFRDLVVPDDGSAPTRERFQPVLPLQHRHPHPGALAVEVDLRHHVDVLGLVGIFAGGAVGRLHFQRGFLRRQRPDHRPAFRPWRSRARRRRRPPVRCRA